MPDKDNESANDDSPERDAPNGNGDGGEIENPLAYAAAMKKRADDAKAEATAAKQARQELQERMDAIEAANQEKLQQRGEYEQLYKDAMTEAEKLRQYQTEADALRGVLQSANTKRIEQIPEDLRDIVPDGLSPTQLSSWLDKSLPKLTRKPAPDIDAGVGGSGNKQSEGTVTEADKAAAEPAQQQGYSSVTAEGIAKRRQQADS